MAIHLNFKVFKVSEYGSLKSLKRVLVNFSFCGWGRGTVLRFGLDVLPPPPKKPLQQRLGLIRPDAIIDLGHVVALGVFKHP